MKAEFSTNQVKFTDYPLELIEGCRRGDQRSQLQIYKLYYKLIYAICLQISDKPSVAESLMHESFLEAFENIGSYSRETGFVTWLLKFIKYDI